MARSFACSVIRSSDSIGRLVKSLIRVSSSLRALRNANAFSASVPSAAAGSAIPQCAVIGFPGQTGQTSPAALSQTVKIKSIDGAPGAANSSQLLLRKPSARQIRAPQELERQWMHLALGEAAGAEGAKSTFA